MKKTLLLLFFAVMIAAKGFCKIGDEFYYNEVCYKITSDNTVGIYSVTDKFKQKFTEYSIPQVVKYKDIIYTVTEIIHHRYNPAYVGYGFSGCSKLEVLTMPNTITKITTDYAFANCTSLRKILFSDALTDLGRYAFQNCVSLQSIVLPSNLEYIPVYVFDGCSNLTEIRIPEKVTRIIWNAFTNSSIKTIYLNQKVEYIYDDAFKGSVVENIIVPTGNPYFSSVDGVLYSKDQKKLVYCPKKTGTYTVLPGTEVIGRYAFYCFNNKIVLPESITTIGDYAFVNCLYPPDIPCDVRNIGSKVFAGTSITRIAIPASTKTIAANAFSGCNQSATIYCTMAASDKPSGWDENWNPDNLKVEWGCREIVANVK